MVSNVFKKIFGSRNDRVLKRFNKIVDKINAPEPTIRGLSDEQLRAKTEEFKTRLAKGDTLAELIPEAFAVVRQAGERTLGHAPLRRPTGGRDGVKRRQNRRNAHRGRQNPGGYAGGLPQCPHR
ncbi:MAG: hypothetical protein R3F37_06320 [Candidatus Competibacteraceae bacterium]